MGSGGRQKITEGQMSGGKEARQTNKHQNPTDRTQKTGKREDWGQFSHG